MKKAEQFPEKLLNIYTSAGKKIKAVENCFRVFNKKAMTKGFAYSCSDTEYKFLGGASSLNFLYFCKKAKENTEIEISNIDAKKQMLTVFVEGELYYEGEGWHYMSRHESMNAIYFIVDNEAGDKQLMVINFSDDISEEVLFILKEDVVDKENIIFE